MSYVYRLPRTPPSLLPDDEVRRQSGKEPVLFQHFDQINALETLRRVVDERIRDTHRNLLFPGGPGFKTVYSPEERAEHTRKVTARLAEPWLGKASGRQETDTVVNTQDPGDEATTPTAKAATLPTVSCENDTSTAPTESATDVDAPDSTTAEEAKIASKLDKAEAELLHAVDVLVNMIIPPLPDFPTDPVDVARWWKNLRGLDVYNAQLDHAWKTLARNVAFYLKKFGPPGGAKDDDEVTRDAKARAYGIWLAMNLQPVHVSALSGALEWARKVEENERKEQDAVVRPELPTEPASPKEKTMPEKGRNWGSRRSEIGVKTIDGVGNSYEIIRERERKVKEIFVGFEYADVVATMRIIRSGFANCEHSLPEVAHVLEFVSVDVERRNSEGRNGEEFWNTEIEEGREAVVSAVDVKADVDVAPEAPVAKLESSGEATAYARETPAKVELGETVVERSDVLVAKN